MRRNVMNTKIPKITVMGSFVVDLMTRMLHLPVPGETVKGGPFKLGAGGKGSNQAVAVKKCGADVTMITKIGQDYFGEVALNNFKKEGINTEYIFKIGRAHV
jgi:ribokinase